MEQRRVPDWTALPEGVMHTIAGFCDMHAADPARPYQEDLCNMRLVCRAWERQIVSYKTFRGTSRVEILGGLIARRLQLFPEIKRVKVFIGTVQDPEALLDLPTTVHELGMTAPEGSANMYTKDNCLSFSLFAKKQAEPTESDESDSESDSDESEWGKWDEEPYWSFHLSTKIEGAGQPLMLQVVRSLLENPDIPARIQQVNLSNVFALFPVLSQGTEVNVWIYRQPSSKGYREWVRQKYAELMRHVPDDITVVPSSSDIDDLFGLEAGVLLL